MVSFTALVGSVTRTPAATKLFTATIDKTWTQGRTAFGGVGAAVALTAARSVLEAANDDGTVPPLRSVNVSFVGPVTADTPIKVSAEILRQGKSVTTVEGKVRQGEGCCIALQASFGASRTTAANVAPIPHEAIPPLDSLKPLELPCDEDGNITGPLPQFLQHFDIRWETGRIFPKATPFEGRRTAMWIRLRDADAAKLHPTTRLLAIADMPPPIIMLHYKVPIMGSTLSWSLEFAQPPESVTSEWFYLDYRLESAADGYSQQSGTIYDDKGQVVAYSRQCMAYFEPKL
jgi:acyl-CoA thioesterase